VATGVCIIIAFLLQDVNNFLLVMIYYNMLSVKIIAVGNLESYFAEAVAEYVKRLGRYCNLSIIQIKHSDQKHEVAEIKKHLTKGAVCLCDIGGTIVSSVDMAKKLEQVSMSPGAITFIIGGSDGVGNLLDDVNHEKISFGRITLPHQLFRVILVEQIYRAFTILNNEKYHK